MMPYDPARTCPKCGRAMRSAYEGLHSMYTCLACAFSIRRYDEVNARVHDQPEDDMLRQLVSLRDLHLRACEDLRWLHHSPGESMDARRGKIMRAKGMCAGVLDLEWPLVRTLDDTTYHGLGIELKYGKGQATQTQRDRIAWLTEQGWRCAIARSIDEAWRLIRWYGAWECSCSMCAKEQPGPQ